YWCYDRHRSVRLVVLVGLAIDQIAQSGLSSLSVIYYSAQLFRIIPIFLFLWGFYENGNTFSGFSVFGNPCWLFESGWTVCDKY
ncbi:hypothetical protein, partial [Citrobacter amalonaticus]|uniref:hypothetical protein n=1 Tax=Citrobacter amalonaticus TaxID=35703 RepID=UPI001E3A612B